MCAGWPQGAQFFKVATTWFHHCNQHEKLHLYFVFLWKSKGVLLSPKNHWKLVDTKVLNVSKKRLHHRNEREKLFLWSDFHKNLRGSLKPTFFSKALEEPFFNVGKIWLHHRNWHRKLHIYLVFFMKSRGPLTPKNIWKVLDAKVFLMWRKKDCTFVISVTNCINEKIFIKT